MIEREFAVAHKAEIDVRIQSGRVELKEGQPGVVRVSVETGDPDFLVEQQGDLVVVHSTGNARWSSRHSAFAVIEIPERSDAAITTASASVDCEVPVGRVAIKTASGNIDVHSADTVSIKTASGDTSIRTITKSIAFSSASGDLHILDRCAGSAAISTASGDIGISDAPATIELNTASGDVEISRFTGRRASFKSMSGTVTVGVPEGTTLDLDASLLSGRLDLPEPATGAKPPGRRMDVKAKLVSGDLTINRV